MKRIAYFVIATHLCFILWSALWMPSKKVEKKPLQIRTVVQAPPAPRPPQPIVKPEVQVQVTAAKPPPVQPALKPPPQPVKTPPPPKKKPAPPVAKAPPAKKPTPKATPAAKKTTPVQQKPVVPAELVQQLQQSIAKIDQKSHKERPKEVLPAPKWIPQLKIDEGPTGEESLFVATLVQCLQDTLNLPEVGEVKVELALRSDGSFVRMKVVRSESERNKKFLEQELKTVIFPPFSGTLKDEKQHTFTITFCNH